jgi:hypothetical protein
VLPHARSLSTAVLCSTALKFFPCVGIFEDYMTHSDEPEWVAEIKRSMVKDLNPVCVFSCVCVFVCVCVCV